MIESPKHMTVMDLRDAFFTPFGAGDFTQDSHFRQIFRSPRGWVFYPSPWWSLRILWFLNNKFLNSQSPIDVKILCPRSAERHWCWGDFPTGFPTPNLWMWFETVGESLENTVAIFDMFQLKKARFLSRINRTPIPSDKKPPMIVPASPRFAPQIPSSIMREFEQKSGCEYKMLNHQLVPQIWPCCSLVIFAGYPFLGGRYSFFLVTFKIPIKVLVLIEIPCAGERSSCRGTNCKKNLATQVDWVPS